MVEDREKNKISSKKELQAEVERLRERERKLEALRLKEREKALREREKALIEREKSLKLEESKKSGKNASLDFDDEDSVESPFSFNLGMEKVRRHSHIGDLESVSKEMATEKKRKSALNSSVKKNIERKVEPAVKPVPKAAKPVAKPVPKVAKPVAKPVSKAAKPAVKPVPKVVKTTSKVESKPKIQSESFEKSETRTADSIHSQNFSSPQVPKVEDSSNNDRSSLIFERWSKHRDEAKSSAVAPSVEVNTYSGQVFEESIDSSLSHNFKETIHDESPNVNKVSLADIEAARKELPSGAVKTEPEVPKKNFDVGEENVSPNITRLSREEIERELANAKSLTAAKTPVKIDEPSLEKKVPTLVRNKMVASSLAGNKLVDQREDKKSVAKPEKKPRKRMKLSTSWWKVALLSAGVSLAVIGIALTIILVLVKRTDEVSVVRYQLAFPIDMTTTIKDGEKIDIAGTVIKYLYSDESEQEFAIDNSNILKPSAGSGYELINGYVVVTDWGGRTSRNITINVAYGDIVSGFSVVVVKNVLEKMVCLNGGYAISEGGDIPQLDLFGVYSGLEGKYKRLGENEYRLKLHIAKNSSSMSITDQDFVIDIEDFKLPSIVNIDLTDDGINNPTDVSLSSQRWWLVAYASQDGNLIVLKGKLIRCVVATNVVENIMIVSYKNFLTDETRGNFANLKYIDGNFVVSWKTGTPTTVPTTSLRLFENVNTIGNLELECIVSFSNGGIEGQKGFVVKQKIVFSEFAVMQTMYASGTYWVSSHNPEENKIVIAKIPSSSGQGIWIIVGRIA